MSEPGALLTPRLWSSTSEVPDMAKRTCSVDGCENPHSAKSFCSAHYKRWLRTGDTGPAEVWDHSRGVCTIEGCERRVNGHGLCPTHYMRWKRTGDPTVVRPHPSRDTHVGWKDDLGYRGAHMRVWRIKGSAEAHTCTCGRRAETWAYDHNDPNERRNQKGYRYSGDPDHYFPLCRKCHKAFDQKGAVPFTPQF